MSLREFESASFVEMRKSLIPKEKGSDLQRQFLEATRSKDTFNQWLFNYLSFNSGSNEEVSLYPQKITEAEFKDTTRPVEKLAFQTWNEITPSVACRSSFWGAVTLNHINNDIIESSYLAVKNNSSQSGLSRIETALRDDEPKLIDDTVRTILRRFSGLPEARWGLRTVYVNCTFGRAWWREKITQEVIEATGGDEDAISRTLRKSQEYWEKLVNLLSTRNSVFGDENIRTSLIWALSDHIDDAKYKPLFLSSGAIDRCMGHLSVYSAYQEFGVFEQDELKEFISKEVIEPVLLT